MVSWQVALVIVSAVATDAAAAASGWAKSNTFLAIAVLVVATATLYFTYPRPAKLVVDRLVEMDEYTADLMFTVHPSPNPNNEPVVPRSYLLNLRVAVANVGRRKAVLSMIAVEHFITRSGKTMFLPESVQGPLWGSQWRQQFGYVNGGQPVHQNISSPGPFVLGPDDVVVVSFRSRRGIDWGKRWDLEKLRTYYDELTDPLESANIKVAWRRVSWWRSAMEVRSDNFTVTLKTLKQGEYVEALKDRTYDFSVLPEIEQQTIHIE